MTGEKAWALRPPEHTWDLQTSGCAVRADDGSACTGEPVLTGRIAYARTLGREQVFVCASHRKLMQDPAAPLLNDGDRALLAARRAAAAEGRGGEPGAVFRP
jgi:hypothetical protein